MEKMTTSTQTAPNLTAEEWLAQLDEFWEKLPTPPKRVNRSLDFLEFEPIFETKPFRFIHVPLSTTRKELENFAKGKEVLT